MPLASHRMSCRGYHLCGGRYAGIRRCIRRGAASGSSSSSSAAAAAREESSEEEDAALKHAARLRLRRKLDRRGLLRPPTENASRYTLAKGAWYDYEAKYMNDVEARHLMDLLLENEPWTQVVCKAYDPLRDTLKDVPQPRLTSHMGHIAYRYSGQTLEPRVPTGEDDVSANALAALMARVNDHLDLSEDERFNHVVLNYYRDGKDSIGWHADAEPQLGRCPLIAALSLGTPRSFHIKRKGSRNRRATRHVVLTDGSLLVMGGTFQHTYLHSVPPEKTDMTTRDSRRINVTFRRLVCEPPPATKTTM